jgi:hypothetical protein
MLILCGVTPNPSFPQMRSLYNRKLLGGAIAGSLDRFVSERNTRVSDLVGASDNARITEWVCESHDRLADQADITVLGVRHVSPEDRRRSRLSAAYF